MEECLDLAWFENFFDRAIDWEKFEGAHKTKNQEVTSPTCEVLGAPTKMSTEYFFGCPRLLGSCKAAALLIQFNYLVRLISNINQKQI